MTDSADDYPRHDTIIEREGLSRVCQWKLNENKGKCPHNLEVRDHSKKIKDSILDCVGNTPMVRINNITKSEGIECEVLAKCEFLNPAGSVKDRIGRRMILDAEQNGKLKPGDILIEPTSGNTGMGLAIAAAAKGYRMIFTMPEKMSAEKQDALRGLGATVIRTPTEYPRDHLHGYIGVAFSLEKELGERAHVLNQYANPGNPMAHYNETGLEIFEQCDGKVDYVVIGAGTGGTITGVSRRLKELDPNIKIIGIDPPGSVLAIPEQLNTDNPVASSGQILEGVGYDFIPRCIDRDIVDVWIKGPDLESFLMARRLMKEEGLMCGGSSGFAMYGALKWIKENNIGKGKRVVVILPDNIRNYMTKHLNADWMYERGYMSEKECAAQYVSDLVKNLDWGQDLTVKDLPLHEAVFIKNTQTCKEALDLLRSTGFDQFPVKNDKGVTVGILTDKNLMTRLAKNQVKLTDTIQRVVAKEIRQVSLDVTLNELARVLNRNSFVLVADKYFVTISDVLDMISPKQINQQETTSAGKLSESGKKVEVQVPIQVKNENNSSSLFWMVAGAILGAGVTMVYNLSKNK